MLMSDSGRNQRFVREFSRHEGEIRAYVRRQVAIRSDADDIFQEVALVLWEKFDDFQEDRCFRAWAYGIARYKVLSWLRDKGRQRLVLDSDVVELIAEESQSERPQFEARRKALKTCFDKIAPEQRSLLSEAYGSDAKIQDVAATSGRSTAGFYQWLYRMRQMLLECVRRELADEKVHE